MSLLKKINSQNLFVKKSLTVFLQVIIILIGLCAMYLLLLEPRLEGVNVGKTTFQIYFNDPFIAYIYLSSIPFFIVLYQAYKLLTYTRHNKLFSQLGVKTLRKIKSYAILFASLIFLADAWLFVKAHFLGGQDDPAGALMIGFLVIFISIIVATSAAIFEKFLKKSVKMKEENDLTI